jgi:hypothetical protein
MSSQSDNGQTTPPDAIYIIRHGEKPADEKGSDRGHHSVGSFGVDWAGNQNPHSLLPRGWQRSGALVTLFDPAKGPSEAGVQTPTTLLSPAGGGPGRRNAHRTYQTIEGISDRLGIPIATTFARGEEAELAARLVSEHSGVVLICWEHHHIPALAAALPTVNETAIPKKWPGHRYDVIWAFKRVPDAPAARYVFGQIPQRLLPGDLDTVIDV